MATPPYHHHCHSSYYCCHSCPCSYSHSHSQSSPPTPTDHLLQSIVSLLTSHFSQSPSLSTNPRPPHHQQQPAQSLLLLKSLHQRISFLESALQSLSSDSFSFSTKPTTLSVRDLAARTIQTHFRSFLVRQSQTLRHLKDLASIKSQVNNLKTLLSDKSQVAFLLHKPEAFREKPMELLHKLDSIQSRDLMIREGKRSISRELVRFIDLVDGLSTKNRSVNKRIVGRLNRKVAENGLGFGVPMNNQGSSSKGMNVGSWDFVSDHEPSFEDSIREFAEIDLDHRVGEGGQGPFFEKFSREEIEGIGGLNQIFEDGRDHYMKGYEHKGELDGKFNSGFGSKNRDLDLSAPLPLQMECRTRSDLVKAMKKSNCYAQRVSPNQ